MSSDRPPITVDNLNLYLIPWRESLEDPIAAQNSVLTYLLSIYRDTGYGKDHHADLVTEYY